MAARQADWNGAYPAGPVTDPSGPATGTHRQTRGGYFEGPATTMRAGLRANHYDPPDVTVAFGTRCCRTLP